jgi:predicted GIY-YIG superfamily endonuclease
MSGYYVYVLENQTYFGMYVGFTQDLDHRLKTHRHGQNWSSSCLGDPNELELYKFWRIFDRDIALRFERYLHTIQSLSDLRYRLEMDKNIFESFLQMKCTKAQIEQQEIYKASLS